MVVFKTLDGKKHSINTNSNINIKKLKSYLINQLKINTNIKLVYKGEILKEDQTLSKIQLKEEDFVIVLPQQTKEKKKKQKTKNPIPSIMTKERGYDALSKCNMLYGNSSKLTCKYNDFDYSIKNVRDVSSIMRSTITNLLGMGFECIQIDSALRLSSGNVELAVEYLLTGISDDLTQQEVNQTDDISTNETSFKNYISYSLSNQQGNVPNQNQVNTWMNQIMQNPALLNQILTAIQRTNPRFYIKIVQEMNQNPQVALDLVQQLFMNPAIMTQVLKSLEDDSQPTRQVFQLSEEEIKQIVQLEKMGFSRDTVIRAFIVSDRNIEVAASLLFSDMDTFHECLLENSEQKKSDKYVKKQQDNY